MKNLSVKIILLGICGLTANISFASSERFSIELETGYAWQSRNDVRIPGDSGTRFALDELTGEGPYPAYRIYFNYPINRHHGLRFLYAPLRIVETGKLENPVRFADENFAADVATEGTYQFNSYRITYHYLVHESQDWQWRVGITAKVRDAEIKLKQGSVTAKDDDVGFVPLLYASGQWQLTERTRALIDMDALGSPQGRAIDLALKLEHALTDQWRASVGYRTVEGGADNDDVFTFAWFNFAVASLSYHF